MNKIYIFLIALTSLLYSCGGKSDTLSVESLKEEIKSKEDSLSLLQKDRLPILEKKHYELIESLLRFYYIHPKDPYAPVCLDKVQMSYSGLGVYFKAVHYADTLINNYPKYANRAMVLESQASNYDIFFTPRDTNKVKYYYKLLLKENPKMDQDKKAGFELRLKHLNLNFEEYIQFISKGAN